MDANQVLSRYAQADLKRISLRTNLRGAKMPDGRMHNDRLNSAK
ncbi:hypothetical protein PQG02_27030 [Nostoc sp. UHCC 0926]|nr:hypothetical protein [Nostoc sp. UHCC 0926]WDD32278.1 hypothetical protein PQG02_27030 [Nostoc sp. UHCC 0926]